MIQLITLQASCFMLQKRTEDRSLTTWILRPTMILSPTEVGNRRERLWPAVVINIPKTWIPGGGHATIPKAREKALERERWGWPCWKLAHLAHL
jgi:hypothetical protein